MNKVLAKNLSLLRGNSGLKQEQISDLIGVSRTAWSDYERGRSEPNISTLIRISEYFNVDLEMLIKKELSAAEMKKNYDKETTATKSLVNTDKENLSVLQDAGEVYNKGTEKDQIIEALREVINTQKILIESLKNNTDLLQNRLKVKTKKPNIS